MLDILLSKRIGFLLCVCFLAASAWGQAQPGNLILQVPDWNQPSAYGVGGYPDWCSPTAGGNLMGYWEDIMGCTGLTDRQVFNASPVYPNTALTWEQGLYHDGMIEMGWQMNTGNWQNQSPTINYPPGVGMTNSANILPGLLSYATGSWTDNDYNLAGGAGQGTGIVKTAYPNATGFTEALSGTPLATMWSTYCGEIDAARPVEVTFNYWVNTNAPNGTVTIEGFEGQTCEKYQWYTEMDPHSVVGVGYIDITPGYQGNNDEWFICQDGWQTTGQYVAVPLDSVWRQNDYITDVPEPATMSLLMMGALSLLRRRNR